MVGIVKFPYSVFNAPFFACFFLWQCLRFGGHLDFEIGISFLECLSVTSLCHWHIYVWNLRYNLRGGADKSLARPTSRCRRTESKVSLEREVCSCAELQVFSCYGGWNAACQATRAISTTSRSELSSSFSFPARQGGEGNSRHSERNIRGICTIVCHRQKLGGPV